MTPVVHLDGAEQVSHAAQRMTQAAQEISSAAGRMEYALQQHQRFLDEWLSRWEAAQCAEQTR